MIFVIRTEVSPEIGNGHLMRCITFCSKFKSNAVQIYLIASSLPTYLKNILDKERIKFHSIDLQNSVGSNEDVLKTKSLLSDFKKVDLLIIDSYDISEKWEKEMRLLVNKILVIDDLANRKHDCDFLIDQNLRDDPSRYNDLVPNHSKIYLGPQYAFLREEFYRTNMVKIRSGKIHNILVFFGSGNNIQEILKVLKVIEEISKLDIKWNLVTGKNINKLKHYIKKNKNPNLNIIEHTDKISELIVNADLAIGTCGVSAWERCFLGLPSIVVVTAENQFKDAEILNSKNAVINLGYSHNVTVEKLLLTIKKIYQNKDLLEKMSKSSLAILNGHIEAMSNFKKDILSSLQIN